MKLLLLLFTLFSVVITTPVLISGQSAIVEVYDLDSTGKLISTNNFTATSSLTYFAFHPTLPNVVYAVLENANGRAKSYSISGQTMTETASIDVGAGPVHVVVEPQARWLYIAGYTSGNVIVISILPNGALGSIIDTKANGANTHQITLDPTAKYLFAPSLGTDTVGQWIVGNDGRLTSNGVLTLASGTQPRHMAFSPTSATTAFLMGEVSNKIFTLNLDSNGKLTVASQTSSTNTTTATYGSTIRISKDGKFLYGGNRDYSGTSSITVFSIGAAGALTRIQVQYGGGDVNYPRDFNMDPTGNFIVVGNQNSDSITVFRRDATSGLLTKLSTSKTSATSPSFVGFMVTAATTSTASSAGSSANVGSSANADSSANAGTSTPVVTLTGASSTTVDEASGSLVAVGILVILIPLFLF
jgi:6-phosphogluconolactonase